MMNHVMKEKTKRLVVTFTSCNNIRNCYSTRHLVFEWTWNCIFWETSHKRTHTRMLGLDERRNVSYALNGCWLKENNRLQLLRVYFLTTLIACKMVWSCLPIADAEREQGPEIVLGVHRLVENLDRPSKIMTQVKKCEDK